MTPLPSFSFPLQTGAPPEGFEWAERDISALSTTTTFDTGVGLRDTFLGLPRCVVCGSRQPQLEYCHVIGRSEQNTWRDLQERGWIPTTVKHNVAHDPRNGLLLCRNHRAGFEFYSFFIRFHPQTGKYLFINSSGNRDYQSFHGKAVALDTRDRYAPFPSLFIIHEMRAPGFHPFTPVAAEIPDVILWQDWVLSDGVFDASANTFIRDKPRAPPPSQPRNQQSGGSAGGVSLDGNTLPLNDDVIAEILTVTRAMPSWKACQIEGTSWVGTAQENIEKYVSTIGAEIN